MGVALVVMHGIGFLGLLAFTAWAIEKDVSGWWIFWIWFAFFLGGFSYKKTSNREEVGS